MADKQEGLGRGLSSLIPTLREAEETHLKEIAVDEISPNPNQPRKHFDPESFKELVSSVKEFGLVQPVVVRPKKEGYELIAGERRWKAAKEAGLKTIPAVVKSSTDIEAIEMALVENIQRENLNAIEEAEAYRQLIDMFEVTQAELARRLGKSRTAVANTLRLLQLPESVKELVVEGNLSSGHARALLSLETEEAQLKLAQRIIKEDLSVRQTEAIVHRRKVAQLPKKKRMFHIETFDEIAEELSRRLQARVKVKGSSKRGRIEITFTSLEELERIFKLIKSGKGAK